ncbi:MAG TPA: hypothetical protein VMZ05_06645 [Spirochaetota bacterium]|nr:hypothetical protein [Spirochaetota bacterium]
MKKLLFCCFVLAFVPLTLVLPVQEGRGEETVSVRLVGKWDIAPYNGVRSGTMVFYDNGTYNIDEKHTDGTGVGRKGQYKLDLSTDPVRIDICLGNCGKPGSEWTTLFSILRFHSDDRLEIRTSPDGNYPQKFSKKEGDDYTMMLTRMK